MAWKFPSIVPKNPNKGLTSDLGRLFFCHIFQTQSPQRIRAFSLLLVTQWSPAKLCGPYMVTLVNLFQGQSAPFFGPQRCNSEVFMITCQGFKLKHSSKLTLIEWHHSSIAFLFAIKSYVLKEETIGSQLVYIVCIRKHTTYVLRFQGPYFCYIESYRHFLCVVGCVECGLISLMKQNVGLNSKLGFA